MSVKNVFCPNSECTDYNKIGGNNIVGAGTIRKKQGGPTARWRCKTCKHTFCETQNTIQYKAHSSKEDMVRVIQLYEKGCTFTAIQEETGFDPKTVSRWLKRAITSTEEAAKFLSEDCGLSEVQIQLLRNRFNSRRNNHTR